MATWTALNDGLSGTALNVNHIARYPSSNTRGAQWDLLYAATDGGVFFKRAGNLTWNQFTLPDPSNAEFGDSPAATVDELTFHWVAFSPVNGSLLFVLAAKDSVSRMWIYKSSDLGTTWTSRGVTTV